MYDKYKQKQQQECSVDYENDHNGKKDVITPEARMIELL
jgi:hypothetical protein